MIELVNNFMLKLLQANQAVLIGYFAMLFIFSMCAHRVYIKFALAYDFIAMPNKRSSHKEPVPQGGGIVFIILWVLAVSIMQYTVFRATNWIVFVLIPLFLLVVGCIDDKFNVRRRWRLISHGVAAFFLVMLLGGAFDFDLGFKVIWLNNYWGSIITFIATVWSINLYNFMDGSDGFAAIGGVFIFGVLGVILYWHGGISLALMCFSLVFLLSGFCVWNLPPARLFMGDSGSTVLGYLYAAISIIAVHQYHVSLLICIMLYTVFWFDATVTLVRRMILSHNWLEPHRFHAFHRLQDNARWSQKKVLCFSVLLNLFVAIATLFALSNEQYFSFIFLLVMTVFVFVYHLIEKKAGGFVV